MKKVIILLISITIMSCNMWDDGNNNNNDNSYEVEPIYVVDGLSSYVDYDNLPRLRGFDATVMDGYDSIEELAADLDRVAMEVGLQYIESFNSDGWNGGGTVTLDGAEFMDDVANEADTNDAGGYETNVQVSGVDEADSVKSDGTYLYTLYGEKLIISDLEGNEIDRDSLFNGNYISGMVLVNNTIIAYYKWNDEENLVIANVSYGEVVSKSIVTVPGYITDIRVSGSDVLIFSDTGFDYWVLVEELFYSEDFYDGSEDAVSEPAEATEDSVDGVVAENLGSRSVGTEEAMERLKSTIPNWRNKIILDHFMDGDVVNEELLAKTQRIYDRVGVDNEEYVNELSGMQRLTTFDVNSGIDNKSEALIFSSGWGAYIYTNGYVSVVASQGWTYSDDVWSEKTYLSAFLTENSDTSALSTGVLDGYLNNQFSMDFYDYDGTYGDGYFRIGLTQGSWWDSVTSNDLYVLDLSSSTMEVIGEVNGLGKPNERIMSMRFMGDRAYMVTFEQTDPFYTLDLSDPTNPQKAGELEIPGFSAYLHPINTDTILAVGRSGDDNGLDGGFQISIYDVSDFANPVQANSYVMPDTWSESTWDHHAFRYYNGMLILPMSVYDYYDFFSGFKVFDIDETTFEISERQDDIPHFNYEDYYYADYYYGYLNPRSMIFTGTEQIVTFKEGRIISSDLNSLATNWTLTLD